MKVLPTLLRRATCALACAAALAPRADAHDFWVEPTDWRPVAGALLSCALYVGHGGEKEVVPRREDHLARFVAASPSFGSGDGAQVERRALVGVEGRSPAGYLRLADAGVVVVGYESNGATVELGPARFEAYLEEEGLEHVSAERARRRESAWPGRERYVRSAKALVRVGDGPTAGFDLPLGLPLELVPLVDPFALADGDALTLRVLDRGRPLAGVLVELSPLPTTDGGKEHAPTRARSDARGVARLELPEGETWDGSWLAAGVHMVRAEEGAEAAWESTWASLCFEHADEQEQVAQTDGENRNPSGGERP